MSGDRIPARTITDIRRDHLAGHTVDAIAARYGVSHGSVHHHTRAVRGTVEPQRKNIPDTTDLGDWHARAVCQGYAVETFFPGPSDRTAIAEAASICATCPVAVQCLTYAQRTGSNGGVFGGRYITQRQAGVA